MHDAPKPAPPEEMVRYLAPLRRALGSVVAHAAKRDRAGLLLDGYVADALHNVPSMLWHYDEASWHRPSRMRLWLERGFPETLRRMAAPPGLVEEAQRIVAQAGASDVLGLPGGPEQVRLPPLDRLRVCLERLYRACVTIRGLRNMGAWPERGWPPWIGLDEQVTAEDDEFGAACDEIARAFVPLPAAVVSWPTFEEQAFEHELLAHSELGPARWRGWWAHIAAL